MIKVLKLTGALWVLGLLVLLILYGWQIEKSTKAVFASESLKAEYKKIVQENGSLRSKFLEKEGLNALEKKIKELGFVEVDKITFVNVPSEMLALKEEK